MRPLLEVQGLTAGYGGVPVLDEVDLAIEPATICAVLGANGAGKTTLVRALSGLIRPAAGQVVYDGRNLDGVPVEDRVRLGLAHVPEGRAVVEQLTVDENLRLAVLWRRDRHVRRDLAEVYELFEPLARRRSHLGHQLSGGERQMLALGRALVAGPRLLLLDEPSLGLAPKVIAEILTLLARLRDTTGLTVLLVEQNVRSALSVADRSVVMALGRVTTADVSDATLRHAYLGF
ncbi:MAG TPA: ABC transporter ATP-binding protein [Mycobacteriales bacterium]|jgi:branched-chain amino acid transport system ATP-binding protein|nr:transporter related protein [Cryptosporangiaceae bacterium]MDQ1675569.1 branched-chain amino acid transport system ATP-binding protein [Actinomycetota bacterium]HEV7755073.1 ABC transporter ATP-binding protein [Mycobacteriales bacterium]